MNCEPFHMVLLEVLSAVVPVSSSMFLFLKRCCLISQFAHGKAFELDLPEKHYNHCKNGSNKAECANSNHFLLALRSTA